MHHIPFVDDIVFPFESQFSCFFCRLLPSKRNEVIECSDFRADKPFLKIRMNTAGGLRRG